MLASFIGVCCYMITGNPGYLILIAIEDIYHEDMTGNRGRMSQDEWYLIDL